MNEEAQTVTTTESNLKDPHRFLPDEMFCHSLSFLSPSGIAISSAVSRNWRASNLADPTLYSVIDLSQPRWMYRENGDQSEAEELEEEMQLYIFHFQRLSSLASNRVKKVSFNLACFLWDWEDRDSNNEFASIDELFSTLILSSTTLKEVSIHLEFSEFKIYDEQGPSPLGCLAFLKIITEHLTDHYSNLRKIELLAPTCISFEVGMDQTDSKFFLLTEDHDSFYSDGDFPAPDTICSIMRCARDFVGTGLTEFYLSTDDQEMESEWYEEIILELWDSRSTLQHLDLGEHALNARKAWELVLSCRNLRTSPYTSDVPGIDLQVGAGEEISPRQVAERNSFKNVLISSKSGCKSMVKWIGNGIGLERLVLSGGRHPSEEDEEDVFEGISSSGLSLGSILFNSRNTLVDLDLSPVNASEHLSFLPSTLPFPKLRVLRLRDCSLQLWSEISKLQSLEPRTLDLWLLDGYHLSENYRARQQAKAFDCLVSILKGNPTLISVRLESSPSPLQEHLKLHHSTLKLSLKLQSLELKSLAASKWFSQHDYPNLEKLEVDEEYRSDFKSIPNELQR